MPRNKPWIFWYRAYTFKIVLSVIPQISSRTKKKLETKPSRGITDIST